MRGNLRLPGANASEMISYFSFNKFWNHKGDE